MSKVSQPKKATGSTASTKKESSKSEELAVSMTIVESEEKAKSAKKATVESTTEETKATVQPVSTVSFEVIQEQAYFLWEKSGYQHGYDEVHWLEAEALVKELATSKK